MNVSFSFRRAYLTYNFGKTIEDKTQKLKANEKEKYMW